MTPSACKLPPLNSLTPSTGTHRTIYCSLMPVAETQVPEANSVSAFFIDWYQQTSLSEHFHCGDDHKKQVANTGTSMIYA